MVTAAARVSAMVVSRRRNRDRRAVLRRLGEEHQHDDAQVEERGDGRGHSAMTTSGAGVVVGRRKTTNLPMNPVVSGMPAIDSSRIVITVATTGLLPPARPTATGGSPRRRRRGPG